MFYNPTIARISNGDYWVMGRFSWQFDTGIFFSEFPSKSIALKC
jgi:hypothetical protein